MFCNVRMAAMEYLPRVLLGEPICCWMLVISNIWCFHMFSLPLRVMELLTPDSFLHDALASTRHDQWVSRLCPLNIWSLNASLFHKKQRKRTWGKMIKGISVFQNEHVSMFICEAKLFVHRQQPDAYVHPKLCWWMSVRSDVNKFHTAVHWDSAGARYQGMPLDWHVGRFPIFGVKISMESLFKKEITNTI